MGLARTGKEGEEGRGRPTGASSAGHGLGHCGLSINTCCTNPGMLTLMPESAVCHLLSYDACLFVFKLVLSYLPSVMLCLTFI